MRIDKFVAAISKFQPLDVTRWGLFIGRPGADNERLNLMVRDISVPGRSIAGNEFAPYGPKRTIAAREEFGDDLSMSFLVGKDGYEREYFSRWMDQVVDPKSGNPNYYQHYVCDLGLQQFDKRGMLRYVWKFYEIYPFKIESSTMNNEASDDAFVTSKIGFNYKNFLATAVESKAEAEDRIEHMKRSEGGSGKPSLTDMVGGNLASLANGIRGKFGF